MIQHIERGGGNNRALLELTFGHIKTKLVYFEAFGFFSKNHSANNLPSRFKSLLENSRQNPLFNRFKY